MASDGSGPAALAHTRAEGIIVKDLANAFSQIGRVLVAGQVACIEISNHLGDATNVKGDNGCSAGERFEHGQGLVIRQGRQHVHVSRAIGQVEPGFIGNLPQIDLLLELLKLLLAGFRASDGEKNNLLSVLHAVQSLVQICQPFAPLDDLGSDGRRRSPFLGHDSEGLACGGLIPRTENCKVYAIGDGLNAQGIAQYASSNQVSQPAKEGVTTCSLLAWYKSRFLCHC